MLSEGDIYARYAPTLMSIADSEEPGSWRQIAASSIVSGVPAYRVKENVLRLVSENPDALGLTTSEEASRFVDELAAENQRAQNELTKQAEQKDPFQRAGLPGAAQQYTAADIVNMNPDVFASIVNRETPKEIQDSLAAIKEYGQRVITRTVTPKSKEEKSAAKFSDIERRQMRDTTGDENVRLMVSNGVARRYGLTQQQVMNPDANDPVQVRANQDYLNEFRESAKLVATLETSGPVIPRLGKGAPFGEVRKAGLLFGGPGVAAAGSAALLNRLGERIQRSSKVEEYEAQQRAEAEAEAMKPRTVVSKSATEGVRREAEEAAKIFSRMRGGQEYNQRVAAAMAERLQERYREANRTPLSDALMRNAIISSQLRK
jgi:hypothetical protein